MFDAVAKAPEIESLPFPYKQNAFCRYEPIEKRIPHAKVLIVNNLLRYESDMSDLALREWSGTAKNKLEFERKVAGMACNNIAKNLLRLVQSPKTMTVHLSEVAAAAKQFRPDAIVMSGTYSDFDYYNPKHLKEFADFILHTKIPVLAICGAHQLVGVSFGASLKTLDDRELRAKRSGRVVEYQYRFVKIVDITDPIFEGNDDRESGIWQDYTTDDDILRVWQNHGVQIDGVPEGFKLLATSYLCKNQMMVKRSEGQLIYSVQFHLEKSFEDWSTNPTRWEHPNESRDGRILFENFLKLALKHRSNS
ncbi:MAG TPA: gamma-glutamyl-gamma-aminobutyrate hydrolase family protein [Pyrinomonadaceae bacterium]|nr:gamma-glutamyl-gamma-aminobutyrate hydrolase family protein [Chloracidobacterium sp.]MBP9934742.1 gamma-glutamyl-gamma-aminobutyrate hydrolase family protein [Pyrinomonadaceae bacterium]MBK7803229.1 gamma-glutamyl-gamma-aminobutyrate hydrolase family protein [Chloracidobacterium sp.]MBK9438128.1 gamma-glutamyl-gamma-aminobutyrate hydrolase family protein [Chloracidobacterium sp.]MBK9767526.1 gamma-glutamyl-gamma-aminobutyrate hydrolase family protein [Chloracidobacterium sp.]